MAINLGLRRRTPEEEEALLGPGGLLSSDAAYTAAPAYQSETTKAINQGVENLKATGLGLRAFGRGVVGDEQGAKRDALASLKTSEDAAVAGPRVQSTKDVKGVGDAAEYVRNTILTQGPNLAASLLGGGAGAAVGRKVVGKVAANAAGKAAAEAAGGSVDDLTRYRVGQAAAKAAKPTAAAAGRGMQVGGAVGAGGSSVALEAGQMAPEGITAESPDDLQTRLFKVGVGSLAAGSIDAYPAFRLLRKTGAFGALAQDEVAKTSRRMLNRIAREAGQQAVVEGGTELAQTVIEKASQKWIDDRINLLSPEAMQEYLDATIAGGTLGFFSGAAGASVSLPANVRASIASRRAAAKGIDLSKGKGGSVAENVARAEEALKEANDDEVDFSDIDSEPDDFEFESFTLPGQQPSPTPDTAASMAQNIPAHILNRIRDPRTPPELRRQLELEVLRRSEQIDEAEAAEVTDKADTSSRQLEAALGDDAQFGISGIQKLFSGGTIKPDWTPDKTLLSAVKRTKGQSLSPDEVRAVKLIDELIGSDPAAKQALVERYGALTDTTEADAKARRYDAAKSGGTAIDPKALKGITRSAASARRFGDRTLRSAIKDLARSGDEEAASMLDTLNKRVADAQGKENDIRKRNKAADGVYGQFLKDLGRKNPALANRVQEQLNSGYEGMSLVDSIHQPARDRFTPESELQVVDKNGNEGVVDIPHLISYLRSVSGETAPRDSTGAIMLNEQFLTQLADNYGKALELLGSDNGELRMGNAKAVQSAMDRDGLVLFHNPKTGDKVTLGTLKQRGYFKSQGGGKITLPNGKEIVVKDDTALINQDGKDFDPADMEQEISGRELEGDARVPGGDTFRANSKRATAPQLDVIEALQGVPANTANARVEAKTKQGARGDTPKRGQITPNDPAFVDQRKPVSDRTQADWNKNVLPAKPVEAAKRGKKGEKVDTSAQNLLDTETGTGGNTALRERVRGNAENAAKAAAAQKGVKANSLSHQMELLARMRKAFKAMTPQERASKKGKALDARIDGIKAYIAERFDTMVPSEQDSGPEPTKVRYKDGPKQAAHKDVHPAAADEVSARRQARRERHFAEKAAEKEKPTPQTNVLPKVRKKRSDSAAARAAEANVARLDAQLDRQDAFAANKRSAIEARAKRIEDRKKVAANKARFQAEKAARRAAKGDSDMRQLVHAYETGQFEPAPDSPFWEDYKAYKAARRSADDTAGPSPADIHELAKSKGIKTDNDPDFMDLSEALTGERHLDAMSPGQLQTIANFLSPMKESVKKANRLLAYVDNIVTTAKPNVESLNRIARGMLDHLGISTKVNVVFVDPADAPTLGFGSVKASPDGSYKITLRSTMRGADLMSTLSHEIGHIIKWEAFDKLSTAEKTEVLEAFESWRDGQIDTVGEAIVSRAPAARQQLIKDAGYAMDKKLSQADANYTLAFDEWFADNAARYLTTDKETTGIIGKFFAEVVMQLRALGAVFGMKAAPDAAIKNLLDGMRPSQAAVRAARYHDSLLRHIAYNNIPPETTAGQAVAAVHALTNPGTRASALSVREIFRGLPDGARYVLTRVVQRNFVANQLRAAVKDPVVLKAMESPEAGIETRVAVAYELWAAGKLKIADAQHPLRAMSDAIMKAVGVMSNTQYFEQFLADTHSGVTNTTRRYDLFARTVRDAKANALGKALSTIEDYYYETVSPLASKVFTEGVGDRLRNRQIPAMTEFALVFKALSGERASDPGLVPARQREAIHLNTLSGKAFEGLDEVDMSAIHDVFMGLSTPGKLTVAQKKAYFAVSKNFDHVYDYLQKAGVKFDKKKNYFPVVMKEAVELGQMHTEFVEFFAKNFDGAMRMKLMSVFGDKLPPKKRMALMDELIGPNKKTAEEVAEIFYRMATGRDDAQTPEWAQGQRPSFRYMNEQLMDFVLEGTPEQLAKFSDFREPNLAYVTHRYNEAAARRAEFQRRFPENDSVEAYFTRAKAQGATEADLTLMRNYMDVMMGNYGLEYPQALKSLFQGIDKLTGTELADNPALARKIQGYILVYQNIRLLGLATLSSITDSLGIAVRSGKFTDIWAAYRDTFKSLRSSGGMKAAWEAAQDLGVVESTVTNEALAMAYGGQYLTRNARRVNDFFFEAIGLTRLTQATRVASTVMAHRFLLRHAKGEGVGARYLAELGLEVGDITSKDGEFIDLHTKNAARDARVRNAMIRFVDESILRPDASQRPLWMSDPNYALITQYKSFTYAFYSTVVKRMAHEFRNGNYQPLMMVLAYVPIMLVAELAREFIKHGEDGDPRRVNWGAEDYAWQATQRTGLLGPKEYLTDALADPARGNLPGASFLGPTAAQARSWMGRKPVQKLSIEALPLSSVTKNYIAPSAPEPVIQEGMQ